MPRTTRQPSPPRPTCGTGACIGPGTTHVRECCSCWRPEAPGERRRATRACCYAWIAPSTRFARCACQRVGRPASATAGPGGGGPDEADDEAAVRELAAWLVRNEIDLVHAHMYRAEVIGTRAAVAAGTPVVMATVHSSRVRSPEDVATLAALSPVMDRLIVPSESILAKVRGRGSRRSVVLHHSQRRRPVAVRRCPPRLLAARRVRHPVRARADRRRCAAGAGEGAHHT